MINALVILYAQAVLAIIILTAFAVLLSGRNLAAHGIL